MRRVFEMSYESRLRTRGLADVLEMELVFRVAIPLRRPPEKAGSNTMSAQKKSDGNRSTCDIVYY